MVRMRASWSSWIWELARSLLTGRPPVGVGGTGMLAAFWSDGETVPAALPGRGGSGMAGGGDGREATDALLRRFCDIELDLFALAASSGAISSNLALFGQPYLLLI